MPVLLLLGLAVFLTGGALDLVAHLLIEIGPAAGEAVAEIGHLITLIGMVLTVAGLFASAWRRRPSSARPPQRRPDERGKKPQADASKG